MLNPVVGEKVEWRSFGIVYTGVVTAIVNKRIILVGLRKVLISDLTAILY